MQDAQLSRLLPLTAVLLLICGGCESGGLQPGAKSIFEVFKQPSPSDAASWAIDKYDADKRYRGTLLLANAPFANEPIYIKVFTDNAKDNDPGVRAASLRGISNHGGPELVPIVVDHLRDTDASVRIEAARSLQRLHNPVAIPALLDALDPEKEPETQVRAHAAEALGQYGESRVIDTLVKTLDDENLAINLATVNSLKTLTGQDFGYDRGAWAAWNKATKEAFAARSVYMYPAFHRDKNWYEYIPFVPGPPNETSSTPAGLQPTAQ
jgi:hypothetical protein